eukprot:10877431-Alexandrium_andersonii.AAC.1
MQVPPVDTSSHGARLSVSWFHHGTEHAQDIGSMCSPVCAQALPSQSTRCILRAPIPEGLRPCR